MFNSHVIGPCYPRDAIPALMRQMSIDHVPVMCSKEGAVGAILLWFCRSSFYPNCIIVASCMPTPPLCLKRMGPTHDAALYIQQ